MNAAVRAIRKKEPVSYMGDSSDTANLKLRTAEEEGRVFNAAEDLPRSFILCADGSIYLSGLSAATLQRRAENEIYE